MKSTMQTWIQQTTRFSKLYECRPSCHSLLVLLFVSFAYFNGGPYQFGKQEIRLTVTVGFCSDCALSVLPLFYSICAGLIYAVYKCRHYKRKKYNIILPIWIVCCIAESTLLAFFSFLSSWRWWPASVASEASEMRSTDVHDRPVVYGGLTEL